MLTVLTRAFSGSLSLVEIGILGYVAMDVTPHYQTALWGTQFRVFKPRLSLVEWAIWCRWVVLPVASL
jgi:uncharacterized membrane protein